MQRKKVQKESPLIAMIDRQKDKEAYDKDNKEESAWMQKIKQMEEALDVLDETILCLLRKNGEMTNQELVSSCGSIAPSYNQRTYRFKESTINARLYSLMAGKQIVFFCDGKWRLPPENINFKTLEAPSLQMTRQKCYCKGLYEEPPTPEGILKKLDIIFTKDDFRKVRQEMHIPIFHYEDFLPYVAKKAWSDWIAKLDTECCGCTDFRVHRGAVDMGRWFLYRLERCNSVMEIEQLSMIWQSYPIPEDHNKEIFQAQMRRYNELRRAGFRVSKSLTHSL